MTFHGLENTQIKVHQIVIIIVFFKAQGWAIWKPLDHFNQLLKFGDLIIHLNKILMIVGQLPSLQQIYDFSSQDLKKIVQQLNSKINKNPNDQQLRQSLQSYIENINIELQQRKTLQFFQQLCAIDNPYLKKVTDFNNQFLKLAEQAIAQQEGKQNVNNAKPEFQQSKTKIKSNQDNNDSISVASQQPAFSEMAADDKFHKFEKTSTATHQKRSGKEESMKKGIGGNQNKMKNSMRDFIVSTLTKNKVEGCYVIKKGGGPPKPQPSYTVNQRGHLVSSNTLQPISTKNIKMHSTPKVPPLPQAPTKQAIQVTNERNEKQLEKKRQEAIQKVKGNKAEKKREKPLNNKDLVQLIREEQRMKSQKVKKKQLQISTNYQSAKHLEKSNLPTPYLSTKTQNVNLAKEQQVQQKKQQQVTQYEEIREQIQVQESTNIQRYQQEKNSKKSSQVIDEIILIQEPTSKDKQSQQRFSTEGQTNSTKEQNITKNVSADRQIKQKNIEKLTQNQKNSEPKLSSDAKVQQKVEKIGETKEKQDKQAIKQNSYKAQINQLQKMREQFETELKKTNQANHQIKAQQNSIVEKPQDQPKQVEQKENDQLVNQKEQKANDQIVAKKCYNEEYWIHVREEAQFKIRRFKEEKQIEEMHKKNIKSQIHKSISNETQKFDNQIPDKDEQENMVSEKRQNQEQFSNPKEDLTAQDQFIQMRKKQLKKMVNEHNKRKIPKRASANIIAPAKPFFALPAFNYLEIYPTFNHIFSVMYTKAEHQALMDVPSIMKELSMMFSTHINHFKDKSNFFQPAIFLPFDSSNNAQMLDPRQLILHAQNTYVNLKKMVQRLQIFNANLHGQFNEANQRYYRVVKTKQEVYDIISTGFLRRKGWKELPHGCSLRSTWNLFWSWSKPDIDVSKLLVWQRINHFPFNKNLSRKDLLYKNLDSFRKMLKIPFNFLPLTFNLPKQYTQFSMKFHEQEIVNKDRNYWIMKPIGKSRGRGIKVISNLAQLNYTDNIVVQKYINNPLLLDGYKFDMRIYVLVTNFHPLEAFVYKQGFARLSTQKFSLDPMFMKNAFVHLTNFAINKNNQDAKHSSNFSGGSKISLKILKEKLSKMNYSFTNIWAQVHEIIIKSLLGCSISVPPFPTAFQLFGYDIMIDTDSNCHLIQINASPSLERSYMIDEVIKQSLIDDILDIVDPPEFDKQQLLDIMSERLNGKKKITPEEDLIAIARVLKYKKLRRFGQIPESIGLFQMVAPSKLSTDLQKLIKGRSGANNPKNID